MMDLDQMGTFIDFSANTYQYWKWVDMLKCEIQNSDETDELLKALEQIHYCYLFTPNLTDPVIQFTLENGNILLIHNHFKEGQHASPPTWTGFHFNVQITNKPNRYIFLQYNCYDNQVSFIEYESLDHCQNVENLNIVETFYLFGVFNIPNATYMDECKRWRLSPIDTRTYDPVPLNLKEGLECFQCFCIQYRPIPNTGRKLYDHTLLKRYVNVIEESNFGTLILYDVLYNRKNYKFNIQFNIDGTILMGRFRVGEYTVQLWFNPEEYKHSQVKIAEHNASDEDVQQNEFDLCGPYTIQYKKQINVLNTEVDPENNSQKSYDPDTMTEQYDEES